MSRNSSAAFPAGSLAIALFFGLTLETFAAEPAPINNGAAALGPNNTKIEFVGVHAGDKPDPRTGGFAKFSGKAQVDPATKSLKSVSAEIDTTSLFTAIPKLTDHLKTADFFEVREFPSAKFESTKIVAGKAGEVTINGKLTLHGVTKEISFPALVHVTDGGLSLKSDFVLDRTQFGMSFAPDKVKKEVQMSIVIGMKTQPPTP